MYVRCQTQFHKRCIREKFCFSSEDIVSIISFLSISATKGGKGWVKSQIILVFRQQSAYMDFHKFRRFYGNTNMLYEMTEIVHHLLFYTVRPIYVDCSDKVLYVILCSAELILENMNIWLCSHFSTYGAGSRNPSLYTRQGRTPGTYKVNTMAVDVVATPGTKASADMVVA